MWIDVFTINYIAYGGIAKEFLSSDAAFRRDRTLFAIRFVMVYTNSQKLPKSASYGKKGYRFWSIDALGRPTVYRMQTDHIQSSTCSHVVAFQVLKNKK